MKLEIAFIVVSLILILIIVKLIIENNKQEINLKNEKKSLLMTVVLLREKLKDSTDSTTKTILANAELGANIVGCFYGYCGGGSLTIGQITKRIKWKQK